MSDKLLQIWDLYLQQSCCPNHTKGQFLHYVALSMQMSVWHLEENRVTESKSFINTCKEHVKFSCALVHSVWKETLNTLDNSLN